MLKERICEFTASIPPSRILLLSTVLHGVVYRVADFTCMRMLSYTTSDTGLTSRTAWCLQVKLEKPYFVANHELDSLVSLCVYHILHLTCPNYSATARDLGLPILSLSSPFDPYFAQLSLLHIAYVS